MHIIWTIIIGFIAGVIANISERIQHSTNGLKLRKARGTCRTR
jgi:uncharacterized membrane protein YeaQ/YmgE (transglycosylase-associated protein family)